MIITKENTRRAVAKCRQRRPHVRFFQADAITATYAVSRTDGTETTVTFFLDSNNRKCATCRCQAGLRGMMCYHVVAAIALHSARVKGNPAAALSRAAQPTPPTDLHLAAPPFESDVARAIAAMDSYFSDDIRAKGRAKWEAARLAARQRAQATAAARRARDEAHEREHFNVKRPDQPEWYNGLLL